MSRIQTSYYGADPTTQFQWATAGTDQFSRTRDIYYLSQAVEYHDHSNGRGLPVARLADGAITAAALAPLSVTTAALANLAVTTAKLADASVTMVKLARPLRQTTNDAAGALSIQESAGTYTAYWWVSTNGIATFAGNGGTPRILVDATGHISMGLALPATASLFNIYQAGGGASDGLRITNPAFDNWRCLIYVDNSAQTHFASTGADVLFGSTAIVYPASDNTHTLGGPSNRWATIYGVVGSFGGSLSSSSLATGALSASTGTFSSTITSALCAPTSLAVTGSGTVSGNFATNAITCTSINTQGNAITCGTISCTSITTSSNAINAGTGTITSGTINNSGWVNSQNMSATGVIQIATGSTAHILVLGVDSAEKPGTATWTVTSDPRSKYASKYRPFSDGLAALRKLTPEYFTYNGKYGTPKGEEYVGIRVEQLSEHAPHMVTMATGASEKADEEIQQVNYHNLFFVLVNAVKELADRVESLEKERRN